MRIRLARLAISAILLGVFGVAGTAHAVRNGPFIIQINSAQEVPTNGSTATATGTITVDTNTDTLYYDITETGVVNETAAHIHGPANPGFNAAVLVGLPAGAHKVGKWAYPPAQEANILNGLTYVNIHTSANPGGEIRGQIESPKNMPATSPWGMTALIALLALAGVAFVWKRRTASGASTA